MSAAPTVSSSLIIDSVYGFVLLECVVIGLHVLLEGFAIGPTRKKLFTKAFYEKNFPHLKGQKLPESGYPDCGGGHFTQKLSYDEWIEFGNAQRAHGNYVEGVATAITSLAVTGLFYPRYATLLGSTYLIGRFFYSRGYRSGQGSRGRRLGVALLDSSLLALMCGGIYGAFNFAGGFAGLSKLVGL